MKRKKRTAEKRQPIPERFSGDGSAPPRLLVWFPVLILFVACACRGGASAPSLPYQRQAHATVAKVHKQLQIKLRAQENGTYIIFEIADKLLKLKCAYAIIILSNNLDGV